MPLLLSTYMNVSLLFIADNKLLVALTRCEPEPLLALPDPAAKDDKYKILNTLSEYYDRELVGTIGWAKQIPGMTSTKPSIVSKNFLIRALLSCPPNVRLK